MHIFCLAKLKVCQDSNEYGKGKELISTGFAFLLTKKEIVDPKC
jgi:hypothetical protein